MESQTTVVVFGSALRGRKAADLDALYVGREEEAISLLQPMALVQGLPLDLRRAEVQDGALVLPCPQGGHPDEWCRSLTLGAPRQIMWRTIRGLSPLMRRVAAGDLSAAEAVKKVKKWGKGIFLFLPLEEREEEFEIGYCCEGLQALRSAVAKLRDSEITAFNRGFRIIADFLDPLGDLGEAIRCLAITTPSSQGAKWFRERVGSGGAQAALAARLGSDGAWGFGPQHPRNQQEVRLTWEETAGLLYG